ncbi:MAG: hypothetical protein ACRDRU_28725 [Pseudonocardiaceae bacterium]
MGWAQVWDLPPITLEKVHYLLPRRRCGCCRKMRCGTGRPKTRHEVVNWPVVVGVGLLGKVAVS